MRVPGQWNSLLEFVDDHDSDYYDEVLHPIKVFKDMMVTSDYTGTLDLLLQQD